MRRNAPDNPARGKAQGRIISPAKRVPARWTADGNRSPEVEARRIPGRSLLQILLLQQAIGHPDENKSGRKRRQERHVGPDRQKCRGGMMSTTVCHRPSCRSKHDAFTPMAGLNLRRARGTP